MATKRKKKRRIRKSLLVILLLIAVAGVAAYIHFRPQKESADDGFTCCSLTHDELMELVESEEIYDSYPMEDYLFYGETLNLFYKEYSLGRMDPVLAKTLIVRNLQSGKEYSFLVTDMIDSQIDLSSLEKGIYSVSLTEDNTYKRIYFEESFCDEIFLVRRNRIKMKVSVIADSSFLEDGDPLDRNYLYLIVEESDEGDAYYDIILDPAYGYDTGDYVEKGATINEITKSEETYAFAMMIRERLEEKGLSVLVTRKNNYTLTPTYGEGGRLEQAYQSKGRYMFVIEMSSSQTSTESGLLTIHSSFTSDRFARSVTDYLLSQSKLEASSQTTSSENGVLASGRNSSGYDSYFIIRESGGRILGAAQTNEKSLQNAAFAAEERQGIQTVVLSYCYLNNQEDAEKYLQNREDYAEKTAEAILRYLGMGY